LAAIPLSDRFDGLKNVLVNQVPMEVERTWVHGEHVIFKFKGVDTISDAERLAGAEVFKPVRGWVQGSDHVPVIVRFKE